MRSRWMIALALFLPAALPVAAGGSHKKCPETTQECLDKMASRMRNSG